MSLWLPSFLVIALLDWVAAGERWFRVRIFTKPLSLIILIAGFSLQGGWQQAGIYFGLGLIFSLGGDVFLLLRPRFFIAGLLFFLFAHIAYISGFLQGKIELSFWVLLPLCSMILLGVGVYPRIIKSVRRKLENRHLVIPVILYMLTITAMLFFAQLTWFQASWKDWAAMAASAGALFFTISDSVLALSRFSKPLRYSNFFVMFTYHIGQLGITLGALKMLGLLG